jgi:hypothetical protein
MTNDDKGKPTLDDNPGLEHGHTTPEGVLMTGAGSRTRDPHGNNEDVTLENDPGLEHDEASRAGRMMTGEGSTGPDHDSDEQYGSAPAIDD